MTTEIKTLAVLLVACVAATASVSVAAEGQAALQSASWMGPAKQAETAAPFASRRWGETIAPFAHVRFCVEAPEQCQRKGVSIRKRGIVMTPARMTELARVHRQVNSAIRPSAEREGPTGDTWSISPAAGDCDDYAVTKRARLLAQGWPSSTLLLTHVVARDGQDHLVLMVRMKGGDVVLDNLVSEPRLRPLERTPIVKIQSPVDPGLWLKPVIDLRITRAGQAARPA
jgi:predicted transglutaminase-like cysteine proteinase